MRLLAFCLAAGVALPAFAQGTLAGRVRDQLGTAIAGAEVRVTGSTLGVYADDSGAFRLLGVPVGPAKLTVRRIGFRPSTADVAIIDGQTTDVALTLIPTPVRLDVVTVLARQEPYDARLAAYQARLKKHVGTFITREKFDANPSATLSDFLREVPGVKVNMMSSGIRNALRFRGQNCAPIVFLDGFPATADEFDVDIVDPASVEGVEIYMSLMTVPPDLLAPCGLSACGVVAIWSRPFRPVPRPAKTVSQAELQEMLETQKIFTADQVDRPVRLDRESFAPPYPDSLWNTYTGGHATVEFVVDEIGHVEMETFSVVSASHPQFGEAVRSALPNARFAPATKGGHRVRQIVQLPTRFARPKS
jgi:TonB family protein